MHSSIWAVSPGFRVQNLRGNNAAKNLHALLATGDAFLYNCTMSLPIVAIVGRPNVGKSSLLNSLVGKRVSIVDPTAGVTRDRVSCPLPVGEGYVELLDTGGIGIVDSDDLTDHIAQQIELAIGSASLILFLVDAQEGVTPLDKLVAEKLRRQSHPVVLVANKVDGANAKVELGELQKLGFGEALPVSAIHKSGIEDLLTAIAAKVTMGEAPPPPVMKLALVGKRNVGKSSFVNALAREDRVIVSEVPGTTRDSVDVTFEHKGRKFVAIDTAGVRKKTKLANSIEWYGEHRSLRSIRRADVVLFLIDAIESVGVVEKHLAAYISENYKPVVLVVNKWDLAKERAEEDSYGEYLTKILPELAFAPIVFTSAIDGKGVGAAVAMAEELFKQTQHRVGTAELNVAVEKISGMQMPKAPKTGKPGKIYYVAQIATMPPTIACFVNNVQAFDNSYQRFMLNQLRSRLPYAEVPIRLIFRARRREDRDKE